MEQLVCQIRKKNTFNLPKTTFLLSIDLLHRNSLFSASGHRGSRLLRVHSSHHRFSWLKSLICGGIVGIRIIDPGASKQFHRISGAPDLPGPLQSKTGGGPSCDGSRHTDHTAFGSVERFLFIICFFSVWLFSKTDRIVGPA